MLYFYLFVSRERYIFALRNNKQTFSIMKSLSQQVDEIVKSNKSKQTKSVSLVKLGLTPYEVSILLGAVKVAKGSKFNANTLTFGVELETYNVVRAALIREVEQRNISIQSEGYNHRDNNNYYKIVSDCSIQGANGQEVVSPILKGKKGLNSLKAVCDSLNAIDARVNKSTGLHVHFDASKISDGHFVQIFKNYQKLEAVIDSFMPRSRRADNNRFCRSLQDVDYSHCDTKNSIIYANCTRYRKVNAESYLRHKTVEFRQHSGTTDYEKISNWINFLRKLIQYSFENEIQECNSIEDIPFLTKSEKEYFVNRRENLA